MKINEIAAEGGNWDCHTKPTDTMLHFAMFNQMSTGCQQLASVNFISFLGTLYKCSYLFTYLMASTPDCTCLKFNQQF